MHPTLFFWVKVGISGVIIATVSEIAKRSPKYAALLSAMPLVTFVSLIWIYLEQKNYDVLAIYSRDTLIWVLPTLPCFVLMVYLFRARVPFVLSLALTTVALGLCVFVMQKLKWLG